MKAHLIFTVAIGLLPSMSWGQQGPVSATRTTLCELVQSPGEFDGKLVELRTGIFPGVEDSPTVLFDRSCSAVVALIAPVDGQYRKTRSYRTLDGNLKHQREVEATLSGVFQRQVVHYGNNARLDFRFVVQSVSDVSKKPLRSK